MEKKFTFEKSGKLGKLGVCSLYIAGALTLSSCADQAKMPDPLKTEVVTQEAQEKAEVSDFFFNIPNRDRGGYAGSLEEVFLLDGYEAVEEFKSKEYTYDGRVLTKKNVKDGFVYQDYVSDVAEVFIEKGMFRNPEEFVLSARVGYFEGAFDGKSKSKREARKRFDYIFSVAKNRLQVWKDLEKEGNYFDVLFRSGMKNGKRRYAFDCIRNHSEYFKTHIGKKDWDMYERGVLNLSVELMKWDLTFTAYNSLVDVLLNETKDPTNGALYYKNPEYSDEFNTDEIWIKRGWVPVAKVDSHVFWKPIKISTEEELANYPNYTDAKIHLAASKSKMKYSVLVADKKKKIIKKNPVDSNYLVDSYQGKL